jgi:hypothetical protein
MAIQFRSIKYGTLLDSAFYPTDGPNIIHDLSMFHIDDLAMLSFPITREQHEAIEYITQIRETGQLLRSDWIARCVRIPFRVVEREHSLAHRRGEVGHIRYHGLTITLEAENGWAEDIFKWICLKDVPSWAEGYVDATSSDSSGSAGKWQDDLG